MREDFWAAVMDPSSVTNKTVNWICGICASKLGITRTEFKDRIEPLSDFRFWPIAIALMSASTKRIEKAKRVYNLIK